MSILGFAIELWTQDLTWLPLFVVGMAVALLGAINGYIFRIPRSSIILKASVVVHILVNAIAAFYLGFERNGISKVALSVGFFVAVIGTADSLSFNFLQNQKTE